MFVELVPALAPSPAPPGMTGGSIAGGAEPPDDSGSGGKRKAGSPAEARPPKRATPSPQQAPPLEERQRELAEVYSAYDALYRATPHESPPEASFLRLVQAGQGARLPKFAPVGQQSFCQNGANKRRQTASHLPNPSVCFVHPCAHAKPLFSSNSPARALAALQAPKAVAGWRRALCPVTSPASRSTAPLLQRC